MKRLSAWVLVISCLLVSVLPLGGCGSIKKKAEKAISEKIVEKALGDKVDIDGDKVTVKGEDGEEVTFGGGEWPESKLTKNLPKFKKGNIVTSASSDEGIMVFLEKVEIKDFDAYLKEVKKVYDQDVYESKSEEMVTYAASDGDKTVVNLNFVVKEGTIGITVTKKE